MQILTLRAWSNAFDFEKLLHTRETQLMICTASCALSHGGLAGSTALTQTCAAGDSGFFPTLSLSHTTTMRPLLTPSPHLTGKKKKSPKFSLESLTSCACGPVGAFGCILRSKKTFCCCVVECLLSAEKWSRDERFENKVASLTLKGSWTREGWSYSISVALWWPIAVAQQAPPPIL